MAVLGWHRHDPAEMLWPRSHRGRGRTADGAQHGDRGKPRRANLRHLCPAPFRYRRWPIGPRSGCGRDRFRLFGEHGRKPLGRAVLVDHGRDQDRRHSSVWHRGPVVQWFCVRRGVRDLTLLRAHGVHRLIELNDAIRLWLGDMGGEYQPTVNVGICPQRLTETCSVENVVP